MRRFALLSLLVPFFVACSSSSSNPAGNPDSGTTDGGADAAVDPAQACSDLANAYCSKIQSCAPLALEIDFGDAGTCVSRVSTSCVAALGGKGTSATAASNEACSRAIGAESCDDIFNGNTPMACVTAPGTVADAAACGEDAQCQSAFCSKPLGKYCGTCARAPAAGAMCLVGRCGPSLACGANGMCVKPGAVGATCDANTPCITTLSCGAGKCAAPVSAGTTCDPKQMTTPGCETTTGYYCNGVTNKCTQVTIATTNEACGIVRAGISLCASLGHCRAGDGGTVMGTCVGVAADGAACDDTNGPGCMAGAHCVNATCKPDDPSTCN